MEALRLLGFSLADASELVSSLPHLLPNNSSAAIQAHGKSVIDLFKRVKPQGDAVSFILGNPRVLDSGNPAPGISLLRGIGVEDKHILAFLKNKPRVIASPGLKSILDEVTSRWGEKDPNSADFIRLVEVWASNNEETRIMKEEAVAEFGWTKSMFYRIVGDYPGTLSSSVDNLVQSLSFLTHCGLDYEDIARYPGLIAGRSLGGNLKPRFCVYNFLLYKGSRFDQKPVDVFRMTHNQFVGWIGKYAGEDKDFLVYAYSKFVELKKRVKGGGKKKIHMEEAVKEKIPMKEAVKENEAENEAVKMKEGGRKKIHMKEAVKENEAVKMKEGGRKKIYMEEGKKKIHVEEAVKEKIHMNEAVKENEAVKMKEGGRKKIHMKAEGKKKIHVEEAVKEKIHMKEAVKENEAVKMKEGGRKKIYMKEAVKENEVVKEQAAKNVNKAQKK